MEENKLVKAIERLSDAIENLADSMGNSPLKKPSTPTPTPSKPTVALPPQVRVGECITLKVLSVGREPTQGISFFEGSKVIINGGGTFLGKTIDVEVVRVHPTVMGFLLFCKI